MGQVPNSQGQLDAGTPLVDTELPAEKDVFSRDYVESLRREAAGFRTKLREYETLGDRARLEYATRIANALDTDEGKLQLFVEAGQSLGVGYDRLEALFEDAESKVKEAEKDLERPLTRAELEDILDAEIRQPLARDTEQRTFERNATAINDMLDALGLEDPDMRLSVLALGNKYVSETESDPRALMNAVQAGYKDYVGMMNGAVQSYVEDKARQAGYAPRPLVGTSPVTGTTRPEPKTMAEAKQRVRERLRESGYEF